MDRHRRAWIGVDFFVAHDRPMMRMSCACGAAREVRALDVTWTPPDTEVQQRLSRRRE
jgi:hypothetical protein